MSLNAAQKEAVLATQGPVLVLAGAGTGKTRVITHRIAHLLRKGVPPSSILAVTFTNKAAREMRERVAGILGKTPQGLTVSTFHSLGARILRADGEAAGLRPSFGIHDTSDQLALLRGVLRDLRGAVAAADARAVLAEISRAKNRFALPADVAAAASNDWENLVAAAYVRYDEALRAMGAADFDDLILLPVLLLEGHPEVRQRYRARFRYLLVDEYQDTNGAQYRLLRALVGPERNVCVVGDDDQSIYGFRGAEVEKILGFESDFPGARVVKLEENYRSTAPILDLANAVIAPGAGRHGKVLRSTVGGGEPVRWVAVPDEEAEVDFVVRELHALIEKSRVPPGDIAILLRAVIQARPFEEKLRLHRLPYTLVGGQSYFDRKEVRDVLAYWKAAANPADDLSLLRILNVPRRGLGTAAAARLDGIARQRGSSLAAALDLAAAGEAEFPAGCRRAAGELAAVLARARERLEAGDGAAAARELIAEAGYRSEVDALYPDPEARQARWAAVEELVAAAERWARDHRGRPFAEFLEALALAEEEPGEDGRRRTGILLMTLHAAKGLEFPHVFLAGVEEDFLPHRKAVAEGDRAIDEERRLLYVGITRARRALVITWAASRGVHGRARPRQPSRFLVDPGVAGLLAREDYDPRAEASGEEVRDYLDLYRKLKTR